MESHFEITTWDASSSCYLGHHTGWSYIRYLTLILTVSDLYFEWTHISDGVASIHVASPRRHVTWM